MNFGDDNDDNDDNDDHDGDVDDVDGVDDVDDVDDVDNVDDDAPMSDANLFLFIYVFTLSLEPRREIIQLRSESQQLMYEQSRFRFFFRTKSFGGGVFRTSDRNLATCR